MRARRCLLHRQKCKPQECKLSLPIRYLYSKRKDTNSRGKRELEKTEHCRWLLTAIPRKKYWRLSVSAELLPPDVCKIAEHVLKYIYAPPCTKSQEDKNKKKERTTVWKTRKNPKMSIFTAATKFQADFLHEGGLSGTFVSKENLSE